MTYTENMGDIANEVRGMLTEMKALHNITKERQEMWEKMIAETTSNNKERLELHENCHYPYRCVFSLICA